MEIKANTERIQNTQKKTCLKLGHRSREGSTREVILLGILIVYIKQREFTACSLHRENTASFLILKAPFVYSVMD